MMQYYSSFPETCNAACVVSVSIGLRCDYFCLEKKAAQLFSKWVLQWGSVKNNEATENVLFSAVPFLCSGSLDHV